MFGKKYKDANNDIKIDENLKVDTINKMHNVKAKSNRLSLRLGASAVLIVALIISSSLFTKNKKVESYAIGIPEYPTKIKFDDFDEEVKRREDIDEKFISNLVDFSINSSSLVLRGADKNTNSLYSPLSFYMALAMVSETAEGETQDEIIKALGMDSIEMIRSETGKLFRQLYFYNEIGRLTFGNSLWLNKDVVFKENTLNTLANDYYAHSFNLDFKDKDSSKKISDWVSENTGGKLGNDPSGFSLNPDDVMTLINTISFYDQWIDEFDVGKTKEDKFYLQDGNTVDVDFMNMTYGSHSFVGVDGYTVSQLYMKNSHSMVFILPDKGISTNDIVSDPDLLKEVLNSNNSQMGEVVFKIPKFKFSADMDLNGAAKELGIVNAFETNSNFTPLSDTKPLFISEIKQSSFISIDEIGVEAAAFTQIMYAGSAAPDGKAEMILDRPFIFAITGIHGAPLFVGIVNNPSL